MNKYIMNICGYNICFVVPYSLEIEIPYRRFVKIARTEKVEDLDFKFDVILKNGLDDFEILGDPEFRRDTVSFYVLNNGELITTSIELDGVPYSYCNWSLMKDNQLTLVFDMNHPRQLKSFHSLIQMISFEYLLFRMNCFILHSSVVRTEKGALLFTAPSGTGKSTQADLWDKYRDVNIINGDKAGIRKIDSNWFVYGLPVAGSSGIFKNEVSKIRALIILGQANSNSICELSDKEKFRMLYPELTVHRWNPEFMEGSLDFLNQLIADVPIYLFNCLPDRTAVDTLESELESRGL